MNQPMTYAAIGAAALFLAVSAPVAPAAEVELGETVEEVKYRLGNPRGEVKTGDALILLYERGPIEFRDQRVVKAELMSQQELIRIQQKRSRQARQAQELSEERREELIEEGEEELDRVLDDEDFQKKPLAEQVAFWDEFELKYPDVDVTEEAAPAREALQQEQEEERARELEEKEKQLAAAPPPEPRPRLSSRHRRAEERKVDPKVGLTYDPVTPGYRPVSGEVRSLP